MGLGLKKAKKGHSSHRKHKQALGLLLLLLLLLRIAPNLGNGSCLGAAPVPTGSAVGSARCYQSGYKFNILRAPAVTSGSPGSCPPHCSRRVDAGEPGCDWQSFGALAPSQEVRVLQSLDGWVQTMPHSGDQGAQHRSRRYRTTSPAYRITHAVIIQRSSGSPDRTNLTMGSNMPLPGFLHHRSSSPWLCEQQL